MKVRSPRNSKRQRRIVQTTLVACAVITLGVFMPRLIHGVAATVMFPIHTVNVWLEESSSLIPTFFRDRRDLQQRIEELENELLVARRMDVTQQRMFEENVRLRELLGAQTDDRILASVLARPTELPYDLLQIDQGSDDGVTVGAPVFIGSDIVVGLVVHTAPTYAFVELVTTPGFEATAFISGPDVVATIEGFGGGVARVRVPQGIPLAVGNLVYLPSVEPGVYGRISHVENRPTQPEQYGYISPETAMHGIHRVAVGSVSQLSQSASEIDARILAVMESRLLVEGVTVGTLATSTATSTPATSTATTTAAPISP